MEYTIQKLARMSGISTRTLRYYDQIDLLKPARVNSSGYRIYGSAEVDRLQQILFHREMGIELNTIKGLIDDAKFDREAALKEHLRELQIKRNQLDLLIRNVEKTIQAEEGVITMSDQEKFEGFKKDLVRENEEKYGQEIREKYGEQTVDESNAKMMNLTKEEYDKMQAMAAELNKMLEAAVKNQESPQGETGEKAAKLHKEWLTFSWPTYSKEAHVGLTEMYLADERFKAYYDGNVEGCAQFLKDAVACHIKE